jgi:hypothetical protein
MYFSINDPHSRYAAQPVKYFFVGVKGLTPNDSLLGADIDFFL